MCQTAISIATLMDIHTAGSLRNLPILDMCSDVVLTEAESTATSYTCRHQSMTDQQ